MSYSAVISHIQMVLNNCGDPVILTPTGNQTMDDKGNMSIEIRRAYVLRQNKCCVIPRPIPTCSENPQYKWCINRIRISTSLADDYSKNCQLSDDEIRNIICSKIFLFGCYEDDK